MKNRVHENQEVIEIELSFSFVAVVTLMFLFDTRNNALLSVFAILVHEGAHVLALLSLRGDIQKIRLSLCEMNILVADEGLSCMGRALVAISGPCMNLLLGVLLYGNYPKFAYVNLTLGFFQLLPITGLDGENALCAMVVNRKLRTVLSLICSVIVALFGFAVLLKSKYNFSILAISLYLIYLTLRERLQ